LLVGVGVAADKISSANSCNYQLKGFGVVVGRGQILVFYVDFHRRPYNSSSCGDVTLLTVPQCKTKPTQTVIINDIFSR